MLLIMVILFFEVSLRYLGFGNPVLYINELGNYYIKPNQDIRRFKGSMVKINHLGMRTNYLWKNTINYKKIIFFGDSVTFGGSYIDNKDLFSEKFCLKIKKSICGNYGVNGFKIDNLNFQINNSIDKTNYDHLIIVVSNSIANGKSNFNEFPFYKKFEYKIFKSITEVLNHLLFKYDIIDNYHKIEINTIPKNKSNFVDTLKELNNNTQINIFILPTMENLNNKIYPKHFLEDIRIKNINIHNMYYEIKNVDFKNLYFNNAHLNKKGHDYFSGMIYDKINEF